MIKRIISLLTVASIVLSFCCISPVWAEGEKYSDPILMAVADTYIRGSQGDMNFEAEDRLVVDSVSPGQGNHRVAFVEFSIDGYEEYVKNAKSIFLTLTCWTDAGEAGAGNKFTVFPLEGEYKNFDLSTVTYDSARNIKSDGVSLVEYSPSGAESHVAVSQQSINIDVTEFCRSSEDDRLVFMIKSTSGAYSIVASENSTMTGEGPRLTIDSEYTDMLNGAVDVANEIKNEFDGGFITDNLDFKTELNGYSISYESTNPDYVLNSGELIKRPLSNEADLPVEFDICVTHPDNPNVEETESFTVNVLKDGASAANFVSITETEANIDFESICSAGEKHILYFASEGLSDGNEYSLYSGSELVADFTADTTRSLAIFDVSDFVSGDSASFVLKGDLSGAETLGTPVVLNVSSTGMDAIMSLYDMNLGDLRNVTSDLNLPLNIGDYSLTWSSSDKSVLADSGRVERDDIDKVSVLSASLKGDDVAFNLAYIVTVLRENTDVENNLYPGLKDPMHTSDERLFGSWDVANNVWAVKPVLRYDLFDSLSDVEAYAKKGDYDTAKSNLLSYYRMKEGDEIYTFEPNNDYDLIAAAAYDKVWTYRDNDKLVGEAEIGTEWNWYSIDLTGNNGSQNGTYWIMESDMDGKCIEIASREHESGNLAFVEIIANGQKRRYPVIADTSISAGDNAETNYGSEPVLISREAAGDATIPFGTNTSRAYMQFGFEADNTSVITSVKLSFYGRATGDKPKKVYCFTTQNSKKFDEKRFAWKDQYPQAFCFKETGFVWRTVYQYDNEWKTEFEWINFSSRLYQTEWLLSRYLVTGNEGYAYRALELAMSQYTQQPGALYPRNLEGGWRTENLIRTMYTAINSEHMTPEIFAAFLKWVYDHANELKDEYVGTANWNSAFKVNYARACAFFPEIAEDGWWQKALDDLYRLYSSNLLNEDGSYTEACTNYIGGVIEEFKGALDVIGAREGEDNEYYIFFREQLNNLCTYYTVIRHPGGKTPPWGDGGRGSGYDGAYDHYEYTGDEFFQWLGTDGSEGTAPDYTTRIYPAKGLVMFKSDWHVDGLSAFLNNDGGGSHGHRDDLALDVNAYGDYLLVDAGVSSYSEGSIFSSARFETINHNTIQIDDKSQEFSGANNPGGMDLKMNGSFDYLKSDSDNKMYPGIDVNRNVLLLKNKFIIVSDSMIPYDDAPHTYRQLWHPDYNFSMELDPVTKAAKTTFNSRPNIKIVPADTGADAKLFNRMMMSSTAGETESRSVQYYKENVSGNQTFDTVLYPEKIGEDTDVRVTRLNLDGVALEDATSFVININDNTGYFYSSNEEAFTTRSFGDYTYNGEMAYVETNDEGDTVYIALTRGSLLESDGESIVEADEELYDFSAKFESSSLKLYSENGLPESGIKIASPKRYKTVYLNDEKVDFEYSDGYIVTNGSKADEESSGSGLKPGTPVSGGKPGSGGGSGSGSAVPVVPVVPENPDEPKSDYPFADSESHWAKDYIKNLYEKEIVSGISENEFAPERAVTRAEFTKILVSACADVTNGFADAGFSDVSSESWYAKYVNTAYSLGIVSGYEDGTFRPDSLITREEMAKMLCSVADIMKKYDASNADISFADNYLISDWAYLYVKKACGLKLFEGDTQNRFNPSANATRAETTAVVCRLLAI